VPCPAHWLRDNGDRHVEEDQTEGDAEIEQKRFEPAGPRGERIIPMKDKACNPPT